MKKLIILTFIPLVLLCGCSKKQISDTKVGKSTPCTVTADCDDVALSGALDLFLDFDRLFVPEYPDSDIALMNYYDEYEMTDDTRELISRALYYCRITDGKYDITLTPAIEQWDFENEVLPDFDELKRVLYRVGYDRIEIKENNINLHNADVDLSSIAKGYIADRAVEYLKENGAKNGVVALGDDIKIFGRAYKHSIKKPFSNDIMFTVKIKNKAVSTCSIDAAYFEKDGELYHHILSTKTGQPINNGLALVTVLGENAVDCDALSTVCMILGEKEGKKLINNTEGYEAVFIKKDNEASVSDGLKLKKDKIVYK